MATADQIDILPPGWTWGQYDSRHRAVSLLAKPHRRLLAAEWVAMAIEDGRRVLPVYESQVPGDDRPRKAIEAAAAVVKLIRNAGAADAAVVAAADVAVGAARAAAEAADVAAGAVNAAVAAADVAVDAARAAAADATRAAVYLADAAEAAEAASAAGAAVVAADAAAGTRWKWLYTTYRHAYGPAGVVFDPTWRSETAVALAAGIYADRAFDRMPILADALEEAGCDDPDVLNHLRYDPVGDFTLADWSIWNLNHTEGR